MTDYGFAVPTFAIAARSAQRWRGCTWPAPISRCRRANALSLQGWRPLFEAAEARADEVAPRLREEIAAELGFLETHWPKDLPGGVIHADLFNDNVFFLGEELSGLIDFYFACNDALAYDLAICLSAWCFEPDNAFNVSKGRAMISAYERLQAARRS